MEPYDTQFRTKTEAFGREHPLSPVYTTTGEGAVLRVGDYDDGASYKVDEAHEGFPVLRAIGRCRVAFAEIVPEDKVKNGYLMRLFSQPAGRRFPIYWLPYELSNERSSMIKLKPSRKLDPQAPGYDSHLFITDALTGCTVTVSGTAEEPIVYHSPQVDPTIRTRVEGFHGSYEQRKGQENPRPVGHWGHAEYGAYFPDLGYKGKTGAELHDLEEKRFTSWKGAKKSSLVLLESATIFGRRDEGRWRLFCQEWVKFSYEWGIFSYSAYEEKMVRRCYPIWPPAHDAPQTATVFVGSTLEGKKLL